ncbi:hypothetical protein BEH94_01965 [Candidatus Altiarchaeales archaeon WOR_SM1_SCG]|nr:hypothetical protein BEH94_01965 [Candidatus Altiarchaeales archaeon WOR_SM1_SCG]
MTKEEKTRDNSEEKVKELRKKIKKDKQGGLVEYAERLSELYAKTHSTKIRKLRGQFFTPKKVSNFMAGLFEVQNNTVRLLDTGAGTGILTAAFCERLLNNGKILRLTVDVYENDPDILPFLKEVMESCKTEFERRGHDFEYNIHEKDFILQNKRYFMKYKPSHKNEELILYDFIISNPPYYKLNKDSPQASIMSGLISGQPNIYALFMALSASMLKPGGEMVFITPRSFCSGLYYKKFREWFIKNVNLKNIHIFESRKEIFDKDEILQENIIIKVEKTKEIQDKILISVSKNKNFDQLKKIKVKTSDVLYYKNGDVFIRIPTSSIGVEIIDIVDEWSETLRSLGLEISTGPVVTFRANDYLFPELTENPKSVPLLWMHNIKDMKVDWAVKKNKKDSAIKVCSKTQPLLLPVENYVLIKRFSSKEQDRRLSAAVLLKSEFPYNKVGVENHLNYIHRPNGKLSVYEAYGISAILNTTFVDNFFRSLNGSTQVNATEIRSLPFPEMKDIIKIGKLVRESKSYRNGFKLDSIVAGVLGIDLKVIKNLNGKLHYLSMSKKINEQMKRATINPPAMQNIPLQTSI